MCRLSEEERVECIPIMLCDEALSYYSTISNKNGTYNEVKDEILAYYTSEEQKGRILTTWQSMRLSDAMRENQYKSEIRVFRQFSYKMSQLQQQLDKIFQEDTFLREQLIISTDIPNIQKLLRERIPRSSQQAINRIATHLSSAPSSAGTFVVQENEDVDTKAM